nr:hypothetical protein [Tanacetum cinerariifolium]
MKQRKETDVSQDDPPIKEHIPTPSHGLLPSVEIKKLKKRVKKLEGKKKKRTHGLKGLYNVSLSVRIISSEEKGLGDQEDASKQERIAKIDADKDLSLINKTAQDQGRMNDKDMFGVKDLDGDEVVVDVLAGEKEEQSEKVTEKEVSTTDPVTTGVKQLLLLMLKDLEAQMQADLEEEQKIAKQKEEEANIAIISKWDNTQAIMDADY